MRVLSLKSMSMTLCALLLSDSICLSQVDRNSAVVIQRRGNNSQGGGSRGGHSHGGRRHGHHHHHNYGFTPYIGYYPGTGYWGGGLYGSSYTRVYSPFGGSFFYGTYAPGAYYQYGPGWAPAIHSDPYPFQYTVPAAPLDPGLIEQQLLADQVRRDAIEREHRKQNELPDFAEAERIEVPLKPLKASSTQQQLRSQRLQMAGDELFREHNHSAALETYRDANFSAPDRPGPYFRMAMSLAMQEKFGSAVAYLKRTLEIDPNWPQADNGLNAILGGEDSLLRNSLLIKVSRWVEQDIRDPDRSLLMGAILHEFDREKSIAFLQTSARMSGELKYTDPYLNTAESSLTLKDSESSNEQPLSPELPAEKTPATETESSTDQVSPRPPDPRPENKSSQPLEDPRFPLLPK